MTQPSTTKAGTQKVDFLSTSRFTIGRQLLHEPRDGPQGAAHGLGYIQVPQVSAPGLVLNRSVAPGDPPLPPKQVPQQSTRRPDLC